MTIRLFFLIITSVGLSSFAQIFMKIGVSDPQFRAAFFNGVHIQSIWTIAANWYVLLGLSMYVLSVGFWLAVLSKVDVTFAYPFVGLGFILTMLFGWLFLQESVGITRVIGTLIIVFGVILVSRS